MTPTTTFYVGISVQIVIGIAQVAAVVLFVYRWQRRSWQFSNLMKIREPLARAYCSLSAVVLTRARLAKDAGDKLKSQHDEERIHQYLAAAQDEILNFSVEHFKAKFWLSVAENKQLNALFDKLQQEWTTVRNPAGNGEDHLDDLRQEILKFDTICGLKKYGGSQWSHVALHE
jgi:hypothetical protein